MKSSTMEDPTSAKDSECLAECMSGETAKKQLANTQILIDVMATRLVAIRQLSLNDFTLKEIRILEGKLMKHFSQQLDAKQKVDPCDIHDLSHYPSLTQLLIVAGVESISAHGVKDQDHSVEDLMKLSDIQLQSIVTKMGGNVEDSRKLTSTLTLLKNCQKNRGKDAIDHRIGTWSKNEDVLTAADAKKHDFNENLHKHPNPLKNGLHGSLRSGSESSGSLPSDSSSLSRLSSNYDPSSTSLAVPDIQGQHSSQTSSTDSFSFSSPSPFPGSSPSLELDVDSGAVHGTIGLSTTTTLNTKSASTPGTPLKTPLDVAQPHFKGSLTSSPKGLSRARFSSSGHGRSLGRPNKLNPNVVTPQINNLKASLEWQAGNKIQSSTSSERASSTYQSSAPASTNSSSTSKLFSSRQAKKNSRANDDLVLRNDNFPDFIALSRTTSARRSSVTATPDPSALSNVSPVTPRTPLTPTTPSNVDMWSKDRDVAAQVMSTPHTPKTPKSGLKSIRAFFTRIGRKPKLKRNRSSDQMLGDEPPLQLFLSSPHRRRSDTLPSSNNPPTVAAKKASAPDTYSLCAPDTDKPPSSSSSQSTSRPTSLIDTDKTLVYDASDDQSDTLVPKTPTNEIESEDGSTLSKEKDSLDEHDLFQKGSMMHSEEWDIPFSELEFCEKIGSGRVGSVHRGNWHGDVAIRVIDVDHNEEEKLKAFKKEIMIYKKTRHENLELFMGSCMHPPRLAIVTGFCRGHSLYNFIRANKKQFINVNQAKIIAQHIVQGMGYLHSKGIIHKDLKSKNIFVEGKKVVITDFGLVGLHAVSSDNSGSTPGVLMIPDGWLCYLAPEVIKALRFPESENDEVISSLPYTMKSDVYAFGTVWYELLAKTWPFSGYSAESIIWQAGSGKKQNLSQLQGGKDVKDIIMLSWSYNPDHRPDFSDNGIMGILKKLQTQIHRSLSSHPHRGGMNRGLSHERLFDGHLSRHAPFSAMHDLVE